MKSVCVLGSTGSIGRQTLEVADELGIRVSGLAAGSNVDLLCEQVIKFRPDFVSIEDVSCVETLNARIRSDEYEPEILCGRAGLEELIINVESDVVLNAIVGFAGLEPTVAAIRAGKDVALANKESLVAAGDLITSEARRMGVSVRPVDSEHSAIWQCLFGEDPENVDRLVLTASGGPFRDRADLSNVTPEEAVKHPNWHMGRKISVDSATLMNKALEVIEASRLFKVDAYDIKVVVHRESVVHSWVEFADGSCKAQFGMPDMRVPIQLALTFPKRLHGAVKAPNMVKIGRLSFEEPDRKRFPAVEFGHYALERGGVVPAVLSAANEAAVDAFLKGHIGFMQISRLVEEAMDKCENVSDPSLEDIFISDRWAREFVIRRCI